MTNNIRNKLVLKLILYLVYIFIKYEKKRFKICFSRFSTLENHE